MQDFWGKIKYVLFSNHNKYCIEQGSSNVSTDRQNRLLVAEDWKRIIRATEMQIFKAMTLII